MEFEKRGIPTATICTTAFDPLARAQLKAIGMPDLRYVLVPHPVGGRKPEWARDLAEGIADQVVETLTRPVASE